MSDSELSIKRHLDAICDEFEEQRSADSRPDFQAFANRVDTEHRVMNDIVTRAFQN